MAEARERLMAEEYSPREAALAEKPLRVISIKRWLDDQDKALGRVAVGLEDVRAYVAKVEADIRRLTKEAK